MTSKRRSKDEDLEGYFAGDETETDQTEAPKEMERCGYTNYLQIDKLLGCQRLLSERAGKTVPDEHLFIIIHQAYELWFKQIIYDLDRIRGLFSSDFIEETTTLNIVFGLQRTQRILKLLVDQMLILETMQPLDFNEFRKYLSPASGFQSLQFRLLENKLGVDPEKRIRYNACDYKEAFADRPDHQEVLERAENEPSLRKLVEKWLERTPGLIEPASSPAFWQRYVWSVKRYLCDLRAEAEINYKDPEAMKQAMDEVEKLEKSYETVINPQIHKELLDKGERRFSHTAIQGAMLIYFYRNQPRFSQPYQILTCLMDIDSLMTKWRYNHVVLVQRMLGNKMGTGGSSGYMYLRSTISDRYKVFLDLFNLSTWLVPRSYVPPLSPELRRKLTMNDDGRPPSSGTDGVRVTPDSSDVE